MNGASDLVSDPDLGLTKREYFAAMAMQGFIAGIFAAAAAFKVEDARKLSMAKDAVEMADELIRQLDKIKPTL